MTQSIKKLSLLALVTVLLLLAVIFLRPSTPAPSGLPKVAFANWGSHASLEETIQSTKAELARLGFKENSQIIYETTHVNFEPTLIMQMLAKLKAGQPRIIVTLSTPVTQAAKNSIKTIPIVFTAITDPVSAGLLDDAKHAKNNLTGATDTQDLSVFLNFAKKILPHAKRVGLLYATAEANDAALVKMMTTAAKAFDLEVVAIPVEQAKEVPLRMQAFKDKVDFIYVGVSGPIQPTLPAIAATADRLHIPVFNADSDAVKKHLVLGSFGVSYTQVGINTAHIIYKLLQGEKVESIAPIYPSADDHVGFISKRKAEKLGIVLPTTLPHVTVVE